MSKPFIVPFVAAKGNVGRTHALLEVARVLQKAGRHVLVMDLDFTSPGIAELAGDLRQDRPGMADLPASPKLAVWHQVVRYSSRHDYGFVGAGPPKAVQRRVLRPMTAAQWRWLEQQIAEEPWHFVLVDMPPGNAMFASTGVRQMLKRAAAICVFAQEGHEHGTFVDELSRRLGPDSVPMLLVEALSQDSGPPKDPFWSKSPLTIQLPRLRALEPPTSPAWGDARFMSAYHQLAEKLHDTVALGRLPLPADLRDVAWKAIGEGISDEPTILRHKARPFLHPRVLVVVGRHGSGKTALARAAVQQGEWAARLLTPGDLPAGWQNARDDGDWSSVWVAEFQRLLQGREPDVPIRLVWDGLDQALIAKGLEIRQVRACLVSLVRLAVIQKDLEPDVDLKIFVQPAWLSDLAPMLDARQLRTITWSASEVFEQAVRRALNASTEFVRGLYKGFEVRLSPTDALYHEDLTRQDLETTATVLLGPRGLTAWTSALLEGDETELVPKEAAELLEMALELAVRSGDRSGALIPPDILKQSVTAYAVKRTKQLLKDVHLTSMALPRVQQQFDWNDKQHLDALNRGLLRWTRAMDGVEIPPLVEQGLGQI